jgi:hypothetical protein
MDMRLFSVWHRWIMRMSMVIIVAMRVRVLQRLVRMFVVVPLGQVEPDARAHIHIELSREHPGGSLAQQQLAQGYRAAEQHGSSEGLGGAIKPDWGRVRATRGQVAFGCAIIPE